MGELAGVSLPSVVDIAWRADCVKFQDLKLVSTPPTEPAWIHEVQFEANRPAPNPGGHSDLPALRARKDRMSMRSQRAGRRITPEAGG